MRYLLLFCLLCASAGLYAQVARPDITNRGDTLFAPESAEYQWLLDGIAIPGAVGPFHVMQAPGVYTVRLRSLISEAQAYTPGPSVVVTGAVLDELLRPINGAEVSVAGTTVRTNAEGRFFLTAQRAQRLAARAAVAGYHAHTVAFMPTAADTQFVYLHLAKQVTTHKLPAAEGGTISQGGFWLTLPPNSVVTADGKPYKGEIQLSVVARRPGDRDFAQRMPGGDFMAKDKNGADKVLYSYGFTGVEMTTADGKPLNMAPDSVATIEFLITEDQRPGAPDTMPLWHFDEFKGLWVETGVVRKQGLTYRAEVPHFSWWNVDKPYPPAYVEGNVVDCKGNPVLGGTVIVNQREAATDNEGRFNGTVPATIDLDFHVVNTDTTLAPLAEQETRPLGGFITGWGAFEAFGVANTNKVLTIYAYGETEGVEYSLNGENWQPEPTFVLETDTTPAQGWARVGSCDMTRITIVQPRYFSNCRVYDNLTNLKQYTTIPALLNATEPVYRIIMQNVAIAPLLAAAQLQPCVLELIFNQSTTLPADMADVLNELLGLWPNLQMLYLNSNQLTAVPESLSNITNLQTLYLSSNQLSVAPEWIGNLTNLQELDLADNRLTKAPETLGNLSNLHTLNLGANRMTVAPDTLSNLTNLRYLSLNENQLTNVSKSLGNLTNLRYLYLGLNQLTVIPESLGNLTNLQTLSFAKNQLTAVPESLGNLTNLKTLWLAKNQLTRLPASFANLADTLEALDLSGNPISPEEQARIRAMLPNTDITF